MIEILDTTLRDGEQTAGVSFNPSEKLAIVGLLLDELKVNRVEIASARVSEGERMCVAKICEWAAENGHLGQIEVLGFIDGTSSLDWVESAGGKVVNLLSKGSLNHVQRQLHKTPQEHLSDILKVIEAADKRGMDVNIYLEDWSDGMKDSPEYVYFMMDGLKDAPVRRFMLPDTLGVLNPTQAYSFCKDMATRYPALHFDFHAHNDYDLATANVYEALRAGMAGIHTTVNGLGERAGNAPLASVLGILNDHLHLPNTLRERSLMHVCNYVSTISGIRIPANKPLVGESVFTQTSGVHADGDKKAGLYQNSLVPERFGRTRQYALGKMSGRANVASNLDRLGIHLTPEQTKLVTARVVELGDKKENVSAEDLPFIIADVLKGDYGQTKDNIHIVNYSLQLSRGMKPVAQIKISILGQEYEETSAGDGQYDAFMKALWKIYSSLGKEHPILRDYQVNIPPGGKTDALVRTSITWGYKGHEFKTLGFDSDQTEAAIKATVKMLNIIENSDILK